MGCLISMITKMIATFFGIGYFPAAPGTAASAVAALLAWFVFGLPLNPLIFPFFLAAIGIWSSDCFSKQINQKDPHCIVIDEVAGMALAVAGLPRSWQVYLAAFVLFRLLDIVKPGPIRRAEQLPGGWGIMTDDLLAGLAANMLIRGFLLFAH